MKMKITGYNLGLGLLSLAPLAMTGCSGGNETEKPNVIFFLIDDFGWSDLGCYGSRLYETPNIDRFAREGIRFTNAYAACHVSSPTRASILTGKYPATIHLTEWLPGRKNFPFQRLMGPIINQQLPYEEITLPEALKDYGYTTAIYGKWHLGNEPSTPSAHGFDVQVPEGSVHGVQNYFSPFNMKGIEEKEGDYLTDRLTDKALEFIDNYKDKPFFLYLSHFAVHNPVQGKKDLTKKYEEKLKTMPPAEGPSHILEGNPDDPNPVSIEEARTLLENVEYQGYTDLPNRMVKIMQHQDNAEYAAMVESMDQSFGRVMAKLKELDLDDNTIVIFFSDNGGRGNGKGSTSNLPLRGGKGWLYEGGIRVPLIVKWPRHGTKGMVCDVPVISIDFYPTIMEMTGGRVPGEQKVEGVSIVPLLEGKEPPDRDDIYWHFPHYSNHGRQSPGGAIRSGNYKLIEYYENYSVQLFDLEEDPGEQHDISSSLPEKVNEMRNKLHQWREKVNAQMPGPNPDYDPEK